MYAGFMVVVIARKDTIHVTVITKQWHIAYAIASRTTSA